mgnify:CR=1 FL=1
MESDLLEKYRQKTQLSQIVDLATKTQKLFLPWVDALAWFREEHPKGRIEAKILVSTPDGKYAKVQTSIYAEAGDAFPIAVYEEEAWTSSTDERSQSASSKAKFWSMAQALLYAGYGCQFGGVIVMDDNASRSDTGRRELPPIDVPFDDPKIPELQDSVASEPAEIVADKEEADEPKAQTDVPDKEMLTAAWNTVWPFGEYKGKTLLTLNREGALKASIDWFMSPKGASYRLKYPEVEKACVFLKNASQKKLA